MGGVDVFLVIVADYVDNLVGDLASLKGKGDELR